MTIENWWPSGVLWLALIGFLSFLMVCTWRYSSFKDLNFIRSRAMSFIFLATMIYLIWNFSEPVLLLMASTFVLSGVWSRLAYLWRRDRNQPTPAPVDEAEQAT